MIVQLSDLHVGADEDRAADHLAEAVRSVGALDPAPAAVIVTGDVVNEPSVAAYERARELLAPLSMPVHVLAGNHDDPDLLGAALAPEVDAGGRMRVAVTCGDLRVVGCDTRVAGSEAGRLDDEELAWLDAQLAARPSVATIVAMHHPPVLTGIAEPDEIGLPQSDRKALAVVVASHPQVQMIAVGHVHRTMTSSLGGCPVLLCPSTDVQLRLDLRRREAAAFVVVDEPPGFAVHVLVEGRVSSHVQPVGRFPAA